MSKLYYNSDGVYYEVESSSDFGGKPFIVDMHKASIHNEHFRSTFWTGKKMQLSLMNIQPGLDLGLGMNPVEEDFFLVESGHGVIHLGEHSDVLPINQPIYPDSAIFVPAGTWRNIINTGTEPLKLYNMSSAPYYECSSVQTDR